MQDWAHQHSEMEPRVRRWHPFLRIYKELTAPRGRKNIPMFW